MVVRLSKARIKLPNILERWVALGRWVAKKGDG
jgi:hypothetical protein